MQNNYFMELSVRLRQEGFDVLPPVDNRLPVERSGHPLCQICGSGSVLYRQEDMIDLETELAFRQVTDIAVAASEYLRMMDQAPDLKADSLHEPYKLLADFNGAVLAGLPSQYGAQFVTWQWSHDRTSLWQGHFYGNNYAGAKQDFAIRVGLIEKNHLFSDGQLAEVYRCIHETLENSYPITAERQKLLEDAARQIEYGVPRLEALVDQSNQRELEVSDGQNQGMTQQL